MGGVIGLMREPGALVLGRYDQRGRLRVVGRTRPLTRAASLEVGAQLCPPRGVHPWPAVIRGGRLGLPGKTDAVAHLPVAPLLVRSRRDIVRPDPRSVVVPPAPD